MKRIDIYEQLSGRDRRMAVRNDLHLVAKSLETCSDEEKSFWVNRSWNRILIWHDNGDGAGPKQYVLLWAKKASKRCLSLIEEGFFVVDY